MTYLKLFLSKKIEKSWNQNIGLGYAAYRMHDGQLHSPLRPNVFFNSTFFGKKFEINDDYE